MLAKVDTLNNYCPELEVTQGLKMVIQVCQRFYFLYKEHGETNGSEYYFWNQYFCLQIDIRIIPPATGKVWCQGFQAKKIVITNYHMYCTCTWSMLHYTVYDRMQILAWLPQKSIFKIMSLTLPC